MRRKILWCLFFFCLMLCVGCGKTENRDELKEEEIIKEREEKKEETLGKIEKDSKVVVLTYGDPLLTGIAETICEAIGAVHFEIDKINGEKKGFIEKAEYILIGTDQVVLELEIVLKEHLGEMDLAGKNISLFLLDQEEYQNLYEESVAKWYPDGRLLPTFTMVSKENLQDELSRMNGWLTTLLTYGNSNIRN